MIEGLLNDYTQCYLQANELDRSFPTLSQRAERGSWNGNAN